MADWSRGYSATWSARVVDAATWADSEDLPGVVSATVERDGSGEAPLVDAGTITLDARVGTEWPERYVRLSMVATQGGASERVDVATLLCTRVSGEARRGFEEVRLSGRSVLWPAHAMSVEPGAFCPRGADGAAWAGDLLRSCLHAPVEVEGGFELADHLVFDLGSTALEAAWQLLRAGGHCIRVAGDGRVRVCPVPTEPDLALDRAHARLLMPSVSLEVDWSEVPNRYIAIDGDYAGHVVISDQNGVVTTVTPASGYENAMYVALPTTATTLKFLVTGSDSKKYFNMASSLSLVASYYQSTVKLATVGDVILSTGKCAKAGTSGAVAKICYLGDETGESAYNYTNGLALALSDANSGSTYKWKTENSDAGHTKQNSSTFTEESGLQYNDATHNSDTYPAFKAAIANNGTTAPTGCSAWFLASGYQWQKMISVAGLSNLGLQESAYYWSSTERNAIRVWYLISSYGWDYNPRDRDYLVRACLAF